MQNKSANCDAIQMSDQMCCGRCGLAWDMNDSFPPECGKVSGILPTVRPPAARPAENLTPGITPDGYSIFIRYESYLEVIIGWANSPQQMTALTLGALGYGKHLTPPSGLEVTVYREKLLDQMAHVSRQRVAFTLPECNRAMQILADDPDPTTHWGDVKLSTALTARKKLEALR